MSQQQQKIPSNIWTRLCQRLALILFIVTILTGASVSRPMPFELESKADELQNEAPSMVKKPLKSARNKAEAAMSKTSDMVESGHSASKGFDTVKKTGQEAWETVDSTAGSAAKVGRKAWDTVTSDTAEKVVKKPFTSARKKAEDTVDKASEGVATTRDGLDTVKESGYEAWESVDSTADGVAKAGRKASDKASNIVKKPYQAARDTVEKGRESVKSTADGVAKTGRKASDKASNIVKKPFQVARDAAGTVVDKTSDGVAATTNMVEKGREKGHKAFESVESTAESAAETGREAWDTVKSSFTD